jgi:hypothetical protein
MLLSLPANPEPEELFKFVQGSSSPIWLPWYVWGGGVFATKYGYDTTKFIGYIGAVSVPLSAPALVKNFRVTAYVSGKSGSTEGALFIARLTQRTNNFSSSIAQVFVDRRNVVVANGFIDITVSAGLFPLSPANNQSLAIDLIGEGQGIATVHGLIVELQ